MGVFTWMRQDGDQGGWGSREGWGRAWATEAGVEACEQRDRWTRRPAPGGRVLYCTERRTKPQWATRRISGPHTWASSRRWTRWTPSWWRSTGTRRTGKGTHTRASCPAATCSGGRRTPTTREWGQQWILGEARARAAIGGPRVKHRFCLSHQVHL